MSARTFIGSSSWTDRSLVGCGRFYPPEVKESDSRLAFYARSFNLTEIDSTYYALPSRRNLESWAGAVPPAFLKSSSSSICLRVMWNSPPRST